MGSIQNLELELKFPTKQINAHINLPFFTTLKLTCGVTNTLEPK